MACCGAEIGDGEIAPSCSDLRNIEAKGYVEIKIIKRAKFFKKTVWSLRYCVLTNHRLYFYKDAKGKSDDPETLVVKLQNAMKISIQSYACRQSGTTNVMTVGYIVAITDMYKRKHKFRIETAEEKQYWMRHLIRATGESIGSEFDDASRKPATNGHSKLQLDEEQDPKRHPTVEPGAEELADKRRNADDYVKWLQRRDTMLECREWDLCAEIESFLPIRVNAAQFSSGTIATSIKEQAIETIVDSANDHNPCQQIPDILPKDETLPELQTAPKSFMDDGDIQNLDASDTAPEMKTETTAVVEAVQIDLPDILQGPTQAQPKMIDSIQILKCLTNLNDEPNKPSISDADFPKKRTSDFVAKMQAALSSQERIPQPNNYNLRVFTSTAGTMQFPAYRSGHTQCHKLVTPATRPKWWIDAQTAKPIIRRPTPSYLRFKCDREANPI